MPRYLVEVTLTLDIECDSPEDIDNTVDEVLTELSPLTARLWRTGDFTVAAP